MEVDEKVDVEVEVEGGGGPALDEAWHMVPPIQGSVLLGSVVVIVLLANTHLALPANIPA